MKIESNQIFDWSRVRIYLSNFHLQASLACNDRNINVANFSPHKMTKKEHKLNFSLLPVMIEFIS
jgi:hypothetical protein